MANQAPNMPAAPAATFDPAAWLSRFESVGGGFLATDDQIRLCIVCQNGTLECPCAAHMLVHNITDDQRAQIFARIQTGIVGSQPDLNGISLETLSDQPPIGQPSSGNALDGQSKGPDLMDMTHAFQDKSAVEPVDAIATWNHMMTELTLLEAMPVVPEDGDETIDRCGNLHHQLMDAPAPNASALFWKITQSMNPDDTQLLAEVRKHLLGTATVITPSLQAEWNEAMARFTSARTAETEHDQAIWRPAYDVSENGGPNIPDEITADADRLTDARCEAEDALITTPTPDLAATIWKIDYARQRWEDFENWPDAWWAAVMSDLRRMSPSEGEGEHCAPLGPLAPEPNETRLHMSSSQAAWDRAYHEYRRLKLKMDAYYGLGPMAWANHDETLARGSKKTNPVAYDKARTRLSAEEAVQSGYYEPADVAALALIKMAAPNLDAVAVKIKLHKDHIDDRDDDPFVWGCIETDLRCLEGSAIRPMTVQEGCADRDPLGAVQTPSDKAKKNASPVINREELNRLGIKAQSTAGQTACLLKAIDVALNDIADCDTLAKSALAALDMIMTLLPLALGANEATRATGEELELIAIRAAA